MVQRIALEVQCHERVHPGRLNPSPRAVRLLSPDDPAFRRAQREPSQPCDRPALVGMKHPVQKVQPSRPRGERTPRARGRTDVQLVYVDGELTHGTVGVDHGERHHGLAGPASEVVNVEGDRRREQHELGGDDRKAVPRPLAEKGQPDPGEDPAGPDAALLADVRRGAAHVGSVGRIARQTEGHVRLNGRREIRGAAEEVGPGPVVALAGADPARGGGRLLLRADAQELAQEEVLRVHGDVRLQLAFPPALLSLARHECGDRRGRDSLRRSPSVAATTQCARPPPAAAARAPGARRRGARSPVALRHEAGDGHQVFLGLEGERHAVEGNQGHAKVLVRQGDGLLAGP